MRDDDLAKRRRVCCKEILRDHFFSVVSSSNNWLWLVHNDTKQASTHSITFAPNPGLAKNVLFVECLTEFHQLFLIWKRDCLPSFVRIKSPNWDQTVTVITETFLFFRTINSFFICGRFRIYFRLKGHYISLVRKANTHYAFKPNNRAWLQCRRTALNAGSFILWREHNNTRLQAFSCQLLRSQHHCSSNFISVLFLQWAKA